MNNWTRPNNPALDATKVPTAIDIAWSAGIYEGEGTCRLCGKGKRGFMISIVQKDPELLYRMRDWFGGSIGPLTKSGCYTLSICGDRARLFAGLIYGFMTARRKAQIDATGAFDVFSSVSPVGLNIAQLQSLMDGFYAEHSQDVIVRNRKNLRNAYRVKSSQPAWREKRNRYNRRARVAMTAEQKEASRKYQQEYYERNKTGQKIHALPIGISA
jgi:hypothetical protein